LSANDQVEDILDDDAHDPLAGVMRGLRAEYLGEAPERVRELSAALGRLRTGEFGALDELQRHFHRLAGSGGSYGFPLITDRSRAAEHDMQELAAAGRPLGRSDFALIEQHVLAVADAFRDAQRTFDQGPPRG
jgi:HPt (histidine-containing phosphotransfer) domain-containing protein